MKSNINVLFPLGWCSEKEVKMRSDKPPKSSLKTNQRKNLPPKRPDAGTEDFIRFVREFQNTRQPTFTSSLQRRAPLPDIGSSFGVGLNDSGFLDKIHDDYDENSLQNEVMYANKVSDLRKDRIVKEVLTITRQQTRDNLYQSVKPITNDCFVLSRQKSNITKSFTQSKQIKGFKRTRQTLKQLPPLFNCDIPDRPTAPSPSHTPPLHNFTQGNEEQVEFLDLS